MIRNLLVLLTASILATGCSGGGGVVASTPVTPAPTVEQPATEQMGFSETDLNQQPEQRITTGETVALFLEQPGQGGSESDTGTDGTDVIPLLLREDSVVEIVLDEHVQTGVLRDAQGSALLQADSTNPVVRASLLAGNYSLELTSVAAQEGRLEFVSWTLVNGVNRLTLQKELPEGDLRGIDLSGVEISGVNLSGSNFSHSKLKKLNVENCNLSRVDLSGSTLTDTSVLGCLLTDADFSDCTMRNLSIQLCKADRARFDRCQGDLDFNLCDLSRTSFKNADLALFISIGSTSPAFPTAPPDFSQAKLHPLRFFVPDSLQNANKGVELPGANFAGASLVNAEFRKGANLDRANFLGADVAGANFFFASLSEAIWVDGQVLPVGQRGAPNF